MIEAISLFKQFRKDCAEYAKNNKSSSSQSTTPSKPVKKSSYSVMEDEDADIEFAQKDTNAAEYPPLIPREVTNIPFPSLLVLKSFTHFLQFHNTKLPKILKVN